MEESVAGSYKNNVEMDTVVLQGLEVLSDSVQYQYAYKVKDEIMPAVKNELKGKMLIEKLNAQKGSLEEIAKVMGSDANVNSSNDVKLNSTSLGSIGFDPVALGKAFSLENGKRSNAFAGENGVVILELSNKTIAPAIGEYGMFKNQLKQSLDGRVGFNITQALKDAAKIEDQRYKFF